MPVGVAWVISLLKRRAEFFSGELNGAAFASPLMEATAKCGDSEDFFGSDGHRIAVRMMKLVQVNGW